MLHFILIAILFTSEHITGTERKKQLKIDALLPQEFEPSRKVLIFNDDLFYDYDLDSRKLSNRRVVTKHFPGINFTIDAAAFYHREQGGKLTYQLVFIKANIKYYFDYNDTAFRGINRKIVDNLKFRDNQVARISDQASKLLKQHVNGVSCDYKHVDENLNFLACDEASLVEGYVAIPSPVFTEIKHVQGCDALEVLEDDDEYQLLMAQNGKLIVFSYTGEKPNLDETLEEIDIETEVFGRVSYIMTIARIALVAGIALFVVLNAIAIGMVVVKRRKAQKVAAEDQSTLDTHPDSQVSKQRSRRKVTKPQSDSRLKVKNIKGQI